MRELLEIMAALRDPAGGCPWDLEQDFKSIAPYTIEEAYEVADVIEREAWDELPHELGDLLLQVVFHSQMARERGWFDFNEVARCIGEKMRRRHPHVFGDAEATSAKDVKASWEATKARERGTDASVLAGIAQALPALTRAQKLGQRAARTGFDWPEAGAVVDKIHEELAELAERGEHDPAGREEELGDVLFCVVNYARHLGVDAERALRRANAKFERRFAEVERTLPDIVDLPRGARIEAMEQAWARAKAREPKA
ncbi:MAG: nucleoside triphosphate pyrophosphohydrolase [Pseudomonadota bacterium]